MISKTPDQRHIYESQQRAARDRAWKMEAARLEGLAAGLEEGRQEGIAKGQRIGQIRLMQQLLSKLQSDEQELADLTLTELDARAAELQARMHISGNSQVTIRHTA